MVDWYDVRDFFVAKYHNGFDIVAPTPHVHIGLDELVILETSGTTVILESQVFKLSGSCAIFYPMGIEHNQINDLSTSYRRWYASYPEEYLTPVLERERQPKDFFIIPLPPEPLERIKCYMTQLVDGMSRPSSPQLDTERRYLLALILNELETLPKSRELETHSERQKLDKLVRRICLYISRNPTADLTIEAIAKQFYISRAKLVRIFKQTIGVTVNDYVTLRRLIHAKELLRAKLPLADVAEQSGFSSVGYFIRVFKREIGITPAKYRASLVKGEKNPSEG